MFRGVTILNLDAKGRLAIPSRHRERLETLSGKRLIVQPEAEWDIIERQFASLPALDPTARALQRLYVGNAQEVDIDVQGRILLPGHLREFASLDKRVAFVGQGVKFEIWDESAWHIRTEAALNDLAITELARESGLGALTL